MAQAFGVPAFPVDTHIHRLADRWGLSNGTNGGEDRAGPEGRVPPRTPGTGDTSRSSSSDASTARPVVTTWPSARSVAGLRPRSGSRPKPNASSAALPALSLPAGPLEAGHGATVQQPPVRMATQSSAARRPRSMELGSGLALAIGCSIVTNG